ncbi:MAG TPA: hypothetical protein PLJ65_09575, partial [Casimicrobium sp.]|nr:hypothetical protein [Casimicrobium sp.]
MSDPLPGALTPIPINYSATVMETALEVGGIGIWNYAPSTRTIDLSHTIAGSKTLPPGRYAGDISGLEQFVLAEDLPAFNRILTDCDAGHTEVQGEFRVRS